MRRHPLVIEFHAAHLLSRIAGLGKRLAASGFDAVWLMGVWERSPAGRRKAVEEPSLQRRYAQLLPKWSEADIAGSPYAIHDYRPDASFGGEQALAECRKGLKKNGLDLIVDFVPNHLAIDHPWTSLHPERFIELTAAQREKHPEWGFRTEAGRWLAHGRDPYFAPWTETAQLNALSPQTRAAMIEELLRIAGWADGVRCDMAMLCLNRIFAQTWRDVLPPGPLPQTEFWQDVIAAVRREYPNFIFIAEAYWDLEWELQQIGFDFTYDKILYDRLRNAGAEQVRAHLLADKDYQEKSVRFIENHDEPRAVAAFGKERSLAAAAVAATLPGMRFFHDGQMEGYTQHVPVQLGRAIKEAADPAVQAFYARLLPVASDAVLHEGVWTLLQPSPAWEGNVAHRELLAWSWRKADQWVLVVVNYSGAEAQGRIPLPIPDQAQPAITLKDRLQGSAYARDSREMRSPGLYVSLPPWGVHLFSFTA